MGRIEGIIGKHLSELKPVTRRVPAGYNRPPINDPDPGGGYRQANA